MKPFKEFCNEGFSRTIKVAIKANTPREAGLLFDSTIKNGNDHGLYYVRAVIVSPIRLSKFKGLAERGNLGKYFDVIVKFEGESRER